MRHQGSLVEYRVAECCDLPSRIESAVRVRFRVIKALGSRLLAPRQHTSPRDMAVLQARQSSHTAPNRERIAFVLVDGLADIHIPAMADLTPLEAADTPTFDAIAGYIPLATRVQHITPRCRIRLTPSDFAAAGLNGLLDPVEPGLACGSDTAHLSILGYEPRL